MEDNNGQIISEQTESAMPTEEQAIQDGADNSLPEEVSERTKAEFEKLKAANAAMKAQLDAVKPAKPTKSVLESLRPETNFPDLSPAQVAEVADQVVDEQGFVDPNQLNERLAKANQIAQQAMEAAKQAQQSLRTYEETQTTKQVYEQYPQLDPNSGQFDERFYKLTRNELVGQLTDGRMENLLEAAKAASEFLTPAANAVQNEEERALKQQASTNISGTSQGARRPVDHDQLVAETRNGSREALYERLQRIGA